MDQGTAYIFGIYDFCVRDDTRNLILLFDPLSELYQFFDCSKNIAVIGAGATTVNSCKIKFNGSGPSNSISALVNTCTMRGDASIVVFPGTPSSKTYFIADSDVTNNIGTCR